MSQSGHNSLKANWLSLPLFFRIGLVGVVVLCCGIATVGIATAGKGGTGVAATATSAPVVHAKATPAGPKATATNTPIRPTATPTASPNDYNTWLANEVTLLKNDGILVTDARYPSGYQIIWIQTTALNATAANTFCKQVAHDYVSTFHQQVIVHFFNAPGINDELAKCSDQP